MILYLDIGNSRIKLACGEAGDLHSFTALSYDNHNLTSSVASAMKILSRPRRVIVSNVAGDDVASQLTACVWKNWEIEPEYLTVRYCDAGVSTAYRDAGKLGIDRWLAIIAAWSRYKKAVCVVDCGTAFTVDMVTASGRHAGGYIVPGPDLMAELLTRGTRQIRVFQARGASIAPGKTTDECIGHGSRAALTGLIEFVISQQGHIHGDDINCIITGGYADDVMRFLSIEADHDPFLVLRGMTILSGNAE